MACFGPIVEFEKKDVIGEFDTLSEKEEDERDKYERHKVWSKLLLMRNKILINRRVFLRFWIYQSQNFFCFILNSQWDGFIEKFVWEIKIERRNDEFAAFLERIIWEGFQSENNKYIWFLINLQKPSIFFTPLNLCFH